MNELALFPGGGGGLLASVLLGWRTVCGVEIESKRRDILMRRQNDGSLDPFPIWDDIRTFDGRPWRGGVDVVSGGFPCQPFSSAARGRNVAEDLWPQMLRVVLECWPRFVFAENVKREPIELAAFDLARHGYRVRFARVDAGAFGAPHRRPRWWVVADAYGKGEPRRAEHEKMAGVCTMAGRDWWGRARHLGMDDGMADRMDRCRALGNGQVPLVAVAAWRLLSST